MKSLRTLSLIFLILIISTGVHANSDSTYWKRHTSFEMLTIEENTPIIIEKEDLVFDFTGEQYLTHNNSGISGLITAKYTMLNPTESSQTVQIAFPFISLVPDFNPKDVSIKVNGEEAPFEVFIGDRINDRSSSEYSPEFYNLDDIITLYTYEVASTGSDELKIGIDYTRDYDKSKIISRGFNEYEEKDDSETIIA